MCYRTWHDWATLIRTVLIFLFNSIFFLIHFFCIVRCFVSALIIATIYSFMKKVNPLSLTITLFLRNVRLARYSCVCFHYVVILSSLQVGHFHKFALQVLGGQHYISLCVVFIMVQGYCCNLNRSSTIYIVCNTETLIHHRNTNETIVVEVCIIGRTSLTKIDRVQGRF